MSQLLTAPDTDLAQRYADTGVVLLRQVLTPDEVGRIREAFTTQIETDRTFGFNDGLPADDILARYPRIVHPHRRPDSEVGKLAMATMLDERILGVVTELIGPALAAQSMFYFKPHDMVRLDASYTYAENKFTDFVDEGVDYTGKYVAASPLHHLNARLTVMPIPELEVELEWDHISGFYTSDLNDDPFGKYQRPDLWHLRVDYQVGTWSVWGQIRNLTDTKYADSVSYSTRSGRSYTPGDGRFFAAGARVTF